MTGEKKGRIKKYMKRGLKKVIIKERLKYIPTWLKRKDRKHIITQRSECMKKESDIEPIAPRNYGKNRKYSRVGPMGYTWIYEREKSRNRKSRATVPLSPM